MSSWLFHFNLSHLLPSISPCNTNTFLQTISHLHCLQRLRGLDYRATVSHFWVDPFYFLSRSLLSSSHLAYFYFASHISRKLDVACGCTTRSSPKEVSFLCCSTQTIRTQTALSIYERRVRASPQGRFKRCRSSDTGIISSLRFFATSRLPTYS
jgi:hypothetical protein